MTGAVRSFLIKLAADQRGASVVETALFLPPFLLLMAGTVDLSMAFSTKLRTQQAAARAAEMITSAGVDALSTSDLQNDSASAAGVPISQVTVERWLECAGTAQSTFEGSCSGGEETARYVSVKVANSYSPFLGPLLPASMAQRAISFVGASTVRVQ